jgi:heme O synthase-like polyprenyltransferase
VVTALTLLVALAARLYWQPSRCAARRMYLYSLLYLALLFTAMAVDRAAA